MTDPDDRPVYRHPAVYRTARGTTLSGGREAAGIVRAAVQSPVRVSESVQARVPESESVSTQDDSAGLYELRRYAEPND